MARSVKGMVVEIGGDTSALQQALKSAQKDSTTLQRELKNINKALKFDTSNITLSNQKEQVLGDSIKANKEYLAQLREEQKRYVDSGGDLNSPAYRQLQRDIENTIQKIREAQTETSKFSKIGDQLTNIGAEFTKSGNKIIGFSDAISSIGSSMESLGRKATAVTTTIVAGLGSAVSRFDTLNNYPKVLSNLGFSAEDAKKSVDDLSNGIDGLPTSLDDAASGVQRLVAKNNDINKSTKYFLAMNDAIVAGNAPAEQQASAIEQLTQSYSKGKPDLMEWRTLMKAMSGQLKQVANAMGYIDTDSLYEGLKNGTISMDEFMDKLVEMDTTGVNGFQSFSDQAHNATDSIGTAITNLGNRVKKGFTTILTNMDNVAKNTSFQSLAGMIKGLSTTIANFLNKIGEGLKDNKSFTTFITNIANSLSKLNDVVNNLSDKQIESITNALIALAKTGPVLLVTGKAISTIGQAGKSLGEFQKAIGGASSFMGQINKNIASGISGMIQLKESITSGMGGISGAISQFAPQILGGFSTAFNITAIVGLLVTGMGKLQQTFGEQINQFAQTAITQGPTIITNFVNGIVQNLQTLIPLGAQMIQTLLDALIANLPSIINGGVDIIVSLVTGISEQLPTLIPAMVEAIMTIVTGLLDNIDKIIDAGIQLIIGLANGLVNAIPKIIEKLPEIIRALVKGLLKALPQLLEVGVQLIIALASGLLQSIPAIIQAVGQLIVNGFQDLKNLPGKALEWGKDMVQGFINGIKGMIGKVGEAASSLGNKVKEYLHFSKPDAGPLRDYKTWMPDMIKGLTTSLHESAPILYKETQNVAGMLKNGLTSGLNNINVQGAGAGNTENTVVNVTFNVQQLTDAELERATNYINTKWGKKL